jgi:hypothetical protein
VIHTYAGRYITCDEPGCTVQTGGICATCHGGEKGMPFAHWDSWSVDGKHFCPRHRKDNDD